MSWAYGRTSPRGLRLYLSLLDRVVLYIMENGNYYNLFLSSKGRRDRFAELNLYPNTKQQQNPLSYMGFGTGK